MKIKNKQDARKRRHYRIRRKISGTAARPRMSVYMSRKHFYVQFIDDEGATTLAQVSTKSKDFDGAKHDRQTAGKVGQLAAERAKAEGIDTVVFDRGGFSYGARMRALADGAREAGLKF